MKNKLTISIILVAAIIIIVNLIFQGLVLRLDFSENKQYTLSKATKDILKGLPETVTVKAYYSEDLPPELMKGKSDFKDLLVEYNRRSRGMVVYTFVNPNEKEEVEQEALQAGIQPQTVPTNLKDQIKIQKIFTGAVITMGERKEVIPVVQAGVSLEYNISKAIKKLSITEKNTIGLLQGHGEPSIQEIIQVYNEMSVLYNIESISLTDTTNIPDRVKTLIIIQPKDSLPARHIEQINNFIGKGGKVLVAYSNAKQENINISANKSNLASWLKVFGINIPENVVYDKNCQRVQVGMQGGGIMIAQLPYILMANTFAEHPISSSLKSVMLPFPSSVEYIGDASKKFTPIVFTSKESGVENLPLYINFERNWDFSSKNIPLAATLEGKLFGNAESKMVVISNGSFIINGSQNQQQQLFPDNINLMANSIDWLSDDTGLVELRSKSVTLRPIHDMSDGTKTTLKWLNFLLPIFLVIIYGFIRFQINRNIRIKRMEESYV
jgi:gliding-associated putative ABC transporter substrate-binding component GldG